MRTDKYVVISFVRSINLCSPSWLAAADYTMFYLAVVFRGYRINTPSSVITRTLWNSRPIGRAVGPRVTLSGWSVIGTRFVWRRLYFCGKDYNRERLFLTTACWSQLKFHTWECFGLSPGKHLLLLLVILLKRKSGYYLEFSHGMSSRVHRTFKCIQQYIPHILWNLKVHCRVQKSLSLSRILSQTNPVFVLQSCICKTNFNIVLPPTPRSSNRSLSFRFAHSNILSVCSSLNVSYQLPLPYENNMQNYSSMYYNLNYNLNVFR